MKIIIITLTLNIKVNKMYSMVKIILNFSNQCKDLEWTWKIETKKCNSNSNHLIKTNNNR